MVTSLLIQFAVATVMAVLCVVIHGIGLFSLARALRTEAALERLQGIAPFSPRGISFAVGIVVAILSLHGIEIWAFAFVYLGIGAISGLEDALYYSTISYSTVGYSDTHISQDWRLLGAFQSMLGMVLIGWSTAFFFRMLVRWEAH